MWISLSGGPKPETMFALGVMNNHTDTNLVDMCPNMKELSDIYKTEIQHFNMDKVQLPILVHSTLDVYFIC